MSLPSIFFASFVFGIAAVVSPGPVSTAIVSQAPRRGWQVGPLVATGHSMMELIIISLVGFGLATIMSQPSIQIGISLLGGVLLIWMGGSMVVSAGRGQARIPGVAANVEALTSRQLIRLGILTTLSNPFWYAWWVTAVPGYLNQLGAVTPLGIGAFYFGHISADYAWDTFLSGVLSSGRRWITNRVYQWLIGLCGLYLAYVGVGFLIQGVVLLSS